MNDLPRPNKVSFIIWASEDSLYKNYSVCYRDIANRAMSQAWDWAVMQQASTVVRSNTNLKKSCKDYIKSNFRPSATRYGYFFLSPCFYLKSNSVINWVTEKLVDELLLKSPSFKNKICLKD